MIASLRLTLVLAALFFVTSPCDGEEVVVNGEYTQLGIEDQLKKVKIPGPSALALSAL